MQLYALRTSKICIEIFLEKFRNMHLYALKIQNYAL